MRRLARTDRLWEYRRLRAQGLPQKRRCAGGVDREPHTCPNTKTGKYGGGMSDVRYAPPFKLRLLNSSHSLDGWTCNICAADVKQGEQH